MFKYLQTEYIRNNGIKKDEINENELLKIRKSGNIFVKNESTID